jgi:hypothetical protein
LTGSDWLHLPETEGEGSLAFLLSYPPVFGEPEGIRTLDPLIKSQVLYRLSYGLSPWPTIWVRRRKGQLKARSKPASCHANYGIAKPERFQ